MSSRVWLLLASAVFAVFLGLQARTVTDPYRFNDDARIWIAPLHVYDGVTPFEDDDTARYYRDALTPPGYRAMFRVAARFTDVFTFSRWLTPVALVIGILLAYLLFRCWLGRAASGYALCLFLLVLPSIYVHVSGGTPRTFAFPLLMLVLLGLFSRRFALGVLGVCLAALLYPPIALILSALLAIQGLGRLRDGRWISTLVGGGLAVAALGGVFLLQQDEIRPFGPMVTLEEAEQRPEFSKDGGRFPHLPFSNPALVMGKALVGPLAGRRDQLLRPPLRLDPSRGETDVFALGLLLASLLLAVFPGRAAFLRGRGRWVFTTVGVSCVLYMITWFVAFRLYAPHRQLSFSMPVSAGLLVAGAISTACDRWSRGSPARLGAFRAAALVAVLLVVGHPFLKNLRTSGVDPEQRRLIEAVAALPEDVLVGGAPSLLSNIPLLARRLVIESEETTQPWHGAFWEYAYDRYRANALIYYEPDEGRLLGRCRVRGITHLVVRRSDFTPKGLDALRRGTPTGLFRPLIEEVRQQVGAGVEFALAGRPGRVVFESPHYLLLDVRPTVESPTDD